MSSTYTPSPTATQSPAGPPAGGNLLVVLPSDGDALNAASVAQAFKVLGDYIAWGRAPFPASTSWTEDIIQAKDALGNVRWKLDHWGMPKHQLIYWDETFTPASVFNATGAGTVNVGRQSIVTVGAAAYTASAPPSSAYSNPPYPASLVGTTTPTNSRTFTGVIDGGSGGNRTELRLSDDYVTSTFAADTLISCEWDFTNFTNSSVLWVLGLAGQGEFVNSVANGAIFIRPNSVGVNWKCRTYNGGAYTEVDSGVLAGTARHVFRIDLVGSTLCDSSAATAFFWIDGALVTPSGITATMPPTGWWGIPTCGGVAQGAIANPVFFANSIRYRQITRAAVP